jgi:RNA polymerase primary sigma factor
VSVDELKSFDEATSALLNRPDVEVLTAEQERRLLLELDECKKDLLEADFPTLKSERTDDSVEPEIQDLVRDLLKPPGYSSTTTERLTRAAVRYNELRTKLAMANLRLVAHVAKKFRNRGLAPSDLIQEGFCGLLKAIDRFDPAKETRLASYAVWWIRQAIQRAVAAGAYPVRLNPRHLQQLANSNSELDLTRKPGRKSRSNGSPGTIRQILSATRPTVSLNANLRIDGGSCLVDDLTYPAQDDAPSTDLDEYVVAMIQQLKPREQVVLQLRYGLGGQQCHSLSEVSEVLDVSKERIRQIQEGALQKLRSLAKEQLLCEVVG